MRSAAATRNAAVNAMAALLNSGTIKLYSGTRPATADTALSGNTLLATGTFGATAFGAAAAGVATANAITQESNAPAGGTATFGRLLTSGGATVGDVLVEATPAWTVITSYTVGMKVNNSGSFYVCTSNVTGGAGPVVDTAHWGAVAVELGINSTTIVAGLIVTFNTCTLTEPDGT